MTDSKEVEVPLVITIRGGHWQPTASDQADNRAGPFIPNGWLKLTSRAFFEQTPVVTGSPSLRSDTTPCSIDTEVGTLSCRMQYDKVGHYTKVGIEDGATLLW